MERRQHRRVRLQLPARIRWITPFGQRTEFRVTEDASRGGLRFTLSSALSPDTHLWVTFPYDRALPDGQPEMPARVARCEPRPQGLTAIAVHLDIAASRNGHPRAQERRAHPRRPLALPLRVRPDYLPWFEEAMTLDVSAAGLRFRSTRDYQPGARLFLSFDTSPAAPAPAQEFRVIRVQPENATGAVTVSVRRIGSFDLPSSLR
ncbi:MAG: PilZ domain-containing protein [Acidobacteriia bacterium]|nr:PilZ domain-containing protein [Terriglobia bacterium]